jgi:hypothetical protein
MSDEATLYFNRSEDDAEVEAIVEYNYISDFDFVPCGEGMVRRNTSFVEIISVNYFCEGKPYKPTDYERKSWKKDIEFDVAREMRIA